MKPGDPQNVKMEHKGEQKWTQEHQKGAKSEPKGAKREPKGTKREPKWAQNGTKMTPKTDMFWTALFSANPTFYYTKTNDFEGRRVDFRSPNR